ncbi:hypothetical protein FLJC2902T_05550 [Flavobacterium limnosediminis JC2902]|uniref:Lipid A 3-O-deacylase PagL n=1 Tax=Flavobacterium limnosediminis JC2902 TaxID=1341181 RepID=V6SV62_9FLAO|nr:acyloxyacyl hydrolase [Flavobacterium limnosediminis]ESU30062.1 hypothetical protein FLJC2902T_05550 [Flavobacterium limnosediminis JC2902]
MNTKRLFISVLLFHFFVAYSQQEKKPFVLGFAYGMGEELNSKDYYYTNSFYKIHLGYTFKTGKHFSYEVVVQPEVNFGTHQLLNKYFVQPDEPDYEALREEYTQLKDVNDYILNIGIIVRTPISKEFSVYVLGSIGPMITDTQTERLSEGFAFSDVIALGLSLKISTVYFDVRPSLRHVSNGGFQGSNSGYNTKNIEFQFSFAL